MGMASLNFISILLSTSFSISLDIAAKYLENVFLNASKFLGILI